jgi:hypothetical protein
MIARRALLLTPLLASTQAFGQGAAVLDVKVGAHAPRRLGPAELAVLPQAEIVEARSPSGTPGTQGEQVRWRGVLLRDVLDAAGMQSLDKRALRRSSVVARASDDYVVVFSLANCTTPGSATTCWSSRRSTASRCRRPRGRMRCVRCPIRNRGRAT